MSKISRQFLKLTRLEKERAILVNKKVFLIGRELKLNAQKKDTLERLRLEGLDLNLVPGAHDD